MQSIVLFIVLMGIAVSASSASSYKGPEYQINIFAPLVGQPLVVEKEKNLSRNNTKMDISGNRVEKKKQKEEHE